MQKPADTKPMNIYQRLAHVAALKEVGYVQKAVDVPGMSGKGVARDLVVATVRKHLLDAGVYFSTTQLSGQTVQTGAKSSKGNEMIRYEGWYETSFINIDEPTDRHTVKHEAHGNDYGDKAPGKAGTYAEKLNLIRGLGLETGIADEGRFAHEWDDTPEEPAKVIGTHNESQTVFEKMEPEEKEFCEAEAKKLIEAATAMPLSDLGAFYDLQNYDSEEKLGINWCLRAHPPVRRKIKDGTHAARVAALAQNMTNGVGSQT